MVPSKARTGRAHGGHRSSILAVGIVVAILMYNNDDGILPVPWSLVPFILSLPTFLIFVIDRPEQLPDFRRDDSFLYIALAAAGSLLLFEASLPITDFRIPLSTLRTAFVLGTLTIIASARRSRLAGMSALQISLASLSMIAAAGRREKGAVAIDSLGAGRHLSVANLPIHLGLNEFGYLCAVATVIGVTNFLRSRGTGRVVQIFLTTATALGLFSTISRGAFVAMSGGLVVILLTSQRSKASKGIQLFVVMFVVNVVVPVGLKNRFQSATSVDTLRRLSRDIALLGIRENPIHGVGSGNYWSSWAADRGVYSRSLRSPVGPHNSYLAIVLYWGLGAIVLPLLALLRMLNTLLVRRRELPSIDCRLFGAITVLTAIWLAFAHTFDTYTPWIGLALSAGVLIEPRQKVPDAAN
jgi:hypothetical protein